MLKSICGPEKGTAIFIPATCPWEEANMDSGETLYTVPLGGNSPVAIEGFDSKICVGPSRFMSAFSPGDSCLIVLLQTDTTKGL